MAHTDSNQPPIFLVGTGRCGSTIIGSVLAMHPELAWVPSWVDALPSAPILAAGSRLWELPGTDRFRETRFFPKPVEPNETFRSHDPTFDHEALDAEILESGRKHLVPLIDQICRYHGKSRFLGKMVGRPVKIDLFDALYDGTFFIHVIRDLKPTLASLLRVDFYDWGPISEWKWDTIPDEYLEFYEQCDRPEAIAAAIGLKLNKDAIRTQLRDVPKNQQLILSYAEFISDPAKILAQIGRSAQLEISEEFLTRVEGRRIYGGADRKWESYFEKTVIDQLDEFEDRFGQQTET